MRTYVFQLLNLIRQNAHMFILILTLQLIQYRRRILSARIRRRSAVRGVDAVGPVGRGAGVQAAVRRGAGVCGKGRVGCGRGVAVATGAVGRFGLLLRFRGRGAAVVRAEEVVARVVAAAAGGGG
jgi:Ni,Fe-hydrogenase III large subunit